MPPIDRPARLILIDADAVFRLGLRLWLSAVPDWQLVAEAATGDDALAQIARFMQTGSASLAIDLVLLDLSLNRADSSQISGLALCQQIKTQYPQLPVLLLGDRLEPIVLAAARQVGASACGSRSLEPDELLAMMRQVLSGQPVSGQPVSGQPVSGQSVSGQSVLGQPIADQSLADQSQSRRSPTALPASRSIARRDQPASRDRAILPAPANLPAVRLTPWQSLRRRLRRSGLQQIDAAIAESVEQLRGLDLSTVDRALVAGRYRELRAARWLVQQLLPPAAPNFQREATPDRGLPQSGRSARPLPALPSQITAAELPISPIAEILPTPEAALFETVRAKLQGNLGNATDSPLEIDVLSEFKKRELLGLILQEFAAVGQALRQSQMPGEQLVDRRSKLLGDLWQAATIQFLGKYYSVPVETTLVDVTSTLLQDEAIVQAAILDKIPGVVELWQHLLFNAPLIVDGIAYSPGDPEALLRATLLLENLLMQVGNAVMQPLLNRFANVEAIKQTFYDRQLLSSREIERFRNNLSWKYRWDRLVRDPEQIFESRYVLLTLTSKGIQSLSVYGPRNRELAQLGGLQLAVTIVLEARDAIAPRLQALVALLGNSVVYVLTEVVGRGIGLVGRGVLKGLGNALQDDRLKRR